jgi:hypothetical protein
MKQIFILCLLFILLFSCNNEANTEIKSDNITERKRIDNLQWLLGTWRDSSSAGQLYEIWTKVNDTLYSGKSFMIAHTDTVFYETIMLELKGTDLFYIPTVRNQNNEQPVTFKLISDKYGEFIFENKNHDFPQRIIYKNPHPDSLYARIEGTEKGKFHSEEFKMALDK